MRRLRFHAGLVFIGTSACGQPETSSKQPRTAHFDSGESVQTPTDTGPVDETQPSPQDAGWTIGPVETCESPSPLRYNDASDALGPMQAFSSPRFDERGSIALWFEDNQHWIVHTHADATAIRRTWNPSSSDTTAPKTLDLGIMVKGLLAHDFDQDGRTDLLGFGTEATILWSVAEDAPSLTTPVLNEDSHRGVYDVAIMDVDHDGDDDIIFGINIEPTMGDQQALLWVQNNGARQFSAPTPILSSISVAGAVFDLLVIDENGDGVDDIYVCNDHGSTLGPNYLLLGTESGTFTLSPDAGLGVTTDCMGVSVGDLDRNGTFDFVLSAIERVHVLVQNDGEYYDCGSSRVPALADGQMGWGTAIEDVDNDGRPDILMALSDFSVMDFEAAPLAVFQQQSDDRSFVEIGAELGLPQAAATRAILAQDLNMDGVVDILASDFTRSPWLFLSAGCDGAHWLDITAPHGSTIQVVSGDQTWSQLVTTNPGWSATRIPVAHFGLGERDTVDEVVLQLPAADGRAVHRIRGPLETNRRIVWSRPDAATGAPAGPPTSTPTH